MVGMVMRRASWFAVLLVGVTLLPAGLATAQELPVDYAAVLKALGKTGDFKDGVLKVNIPRSDLRVTIGGRPAPTPFGFGGWIALTQGRRRSRGHDGRPRADRGRGQPGHVGDPRQRPRRDRAAQPLLLGTAAHLLHARARHGHAPQIWRVAQARHRPDRQGRRRARVPRRPHPRPAAPRCDTAALAAIVGQPGNRTAPSTRSPSGGPTSTCASMARRSTRAWASTRGRPSRAPMRTRWWRATSRCSSTRSRRSSRRCAPTASTSSRSTTT